MNQSVALAEYKRLCQLINKPPYGDCQLVALMLWIKLGGEIIRGNLLMEDGRNVNHYWIEKDGEMFDPLSADWEVAIESRLSRIAIDPLEIISEWQAFIAEFPQPAKYELFPLRWAIKDEILSYLEVD